MAMPQTFHLGELHAHGGRIAFKAASPLVFDGHLGESVEFVLRYAFEEASRERESLRVRVTATFDGAPLERAERTVKDRPGLQDSVEGALFLSGTLARRGALEGTFVIEAAYAHDAWESGARAPVETFRETGRFVVNVA